MQEIIYIMETIREQIPSINEMKIILIEKNEKMNKAILSKK
jgi:hypothetical protein